MKECDILGGSKHALHTLTPPTYIQKVKTPNPRIYTLLGKGRFVRRRLQNKTTTDREGSVSVTNPHSGVQAHCCSK